MVQKAIWIISHYSFINNYKEFLKSLYSIQFAKTPIPIERYIWNFADEIPVPDKGNILVEYDIGNTNIPFYIPIDHYAPYVSEKDIEYTFKCLGWDELIIAIIQLSLEKKVLLVSKYKSLLSAVSTTLTSLLFPFKWMHVLIPILPDEMSSFLEWPFPFLIGTEKRFYDKTKNEIPEDVIVINLDKGEMKTSEGLPKMPAKEFKLLSSRVRKASSSILLPQSSEEREKELKMCEDAFLFNVNMLLNDMMDWDKHKFDALEIRDAFLEFFCMILKNYQVYMISPDKTEGIVTDARDCFKFASFRSHKEASKPETYIYQLTWTTLFNTFIEIRAFKDPEEEEEINFFDNAMKLK